MTTLLPKRWTVSAEAGKAAGVPIALFVALAANAWHRPDPNTLDRVLFDRINAKSDSVTFFVARALSYVASPPVAAVLAVGLAWWLLRTRRDVVAAIVVVVAPIIAALVQLAVKPLAQRDRPSTMVLTHATGYGFPSGVAAGFGAIGTVVALLLLANRIPSKNIVKTTSLVVVAMLLAAFDRIFVGAHFFTDALAGLSVGVGTACVCVFLMPFLDGKTEGWSERVPKSLLPRPK